MWWRVCINALSMGGRDLENDNMELKDLSSSCQFSVRLSGILAIANNMCQPHHVNEMRHSLQNYPNINTLWASLIIEECSRLGLTVVETSQDFVPLLLTADHPPELQDAGANQAINQIGSRITSKRISQMLEDCFPCSYIMVENHHSRHDPSHIVTHRIQSTVTQFADCLLKAYIPRISSKWCGVLRAVDKMVICVIGDVSFLHDTNGLALLNQSVKHVQVQTKMELEDAMLTSQQEEIDIIIEVESCIDANATFHKYSVG